MIALETTHSSKNADVSPSSPLSLSTPDEEPKLSFSQLLKGVGNKDDKVIQNGALVLSLEGDEKGVKTNSKPTTKNDVLLSLLKNDDMPKEVLELNPKLTQNMTSKELKVLISDAKEYLKSKITNSDEYKKSQMPELPKTLKGLATLAKTIGIDISKLSIEEIQPSKTQSVKPSEIKALQRDESKQVLNVDEKTTKPQKLDVKTTQDIISSKKEGVKATAVVAETAMAKAQTKTQEYGIVEDKKTEINKQTQSAKPTLLFKAQSSKEHTTEQIVQTKQFKVEEKTPKSRADETLKLLLRGEKPSVINTTLTADFSVATAKVIAPNAQSDATKSLEALLHGDKNESTTASKTDGLIAHKSDSFEVKLNEAKQMIKYLSSDVKTAIEDYKSPFTRVKVQLNPQKLGEIDLTIVQRGKNLHVNISSNNTAINTLSMNANELRTQLSNSGINNATLNFNNSSQNSDSNAQGQQQNRHNERQADEEYNYFENEEANEEILSSLEIIVPRYV